MRRRESRSFQVMLSRYRGTSQGRERKHRKITNGSILYCTMYQNDNIPTSQQGHSMDREYASVGREVFESSRVQPQYNSRSGARHVTAPRTMVQPCHLHRFHIFRRPVPSLTSTRERTSGEGRRTFLAASWITPPEATPERDKNLSCVGLSGGLCTTQLSNYSLV
jgi:hypothetical protein